MKAPSSFFRPACGALILLALLLPVRSLADEGEAKTEAPDTVRAEGAAPGEWTQDWDAAMAGAWANGLPVFANFTGSDWCGWCKAMKKRVFDTPEWKGWSSNRIYLVQINFPKDKSLVPEPFRERNRDLAERFQVSGYPTCLLINPTNQTVCGRWGGYRNSLFAKDYIARFDDALRGRSGASGEGSPAPDGEGQSSSSASGGPFRLPVELLPERGRIVWADFEGRAAADRIHPGRAFACQNAEFVDGGMRLRADSFNSAEGRRRSMASIAIPELDFDKYAFGFSFRLDNVAWTLLAAFGSPRWLGVWLDASPQRRMTIEFGKTASEFHREFHVDAADARTNEWNWIVCSVDSVGKTVSVVLNGRRAGEFRLPDNFAYFIPPWLRGPAKTAVFSGPPGRSGDWLDVDDFVFYGRALSPREMESLVSGGGEDAPTEWILTRLPGKSLFWNATLTNGHWRLGAHVEGERVTIYPEFPPPRRILDFSLPVRDARGGSYSIVGVGMDREPLPSANPAASLNRISSSLADLRLPKTLEWIGPGAFANCRYLEEVDIPDGVSAIYRYAFAGCARLRRARLPSSLRKFSESGVFASCPVLESIDVAEGCPAFASVDGVLFTKDGSTLLCFPGGRSGRYEVPAGVERIPSRAFPVAGRLRKSRSRHRWPRLTRKLSATAPP